MSPVDPYRLSADQQGVFVTAALISAVGVGQAVTYSQLRWLYEHARHIERSDGWAKITATELAEDTGMPVKTVRRHLTDFMEKGWVERRQDIGKTFDRASWWRLPGADSGTSMSAKRGHDKSPKWGHVPTTETGKTTVSAAPKREHGAATTRKRTAADDLFDALLAVDGVEPGTKLTRTQGSMYGKLRRELTEVDATPDEVTRRARRYRSLHPSWELTAAALVKHWGSLTPKRPSAKKTRKDDAGGVNVGPDAFARAVYGKDQDDG